MIKPLVSVIIVNWNGGAVFKDCLSSLKKISYPRWELIVVDNGSSDQSLKFLSNLKFKTLNFKLIENKTNLGFAKANNQGFEKSSGKYILLLNNDTRVTADFLDLLVEKLEEDKLIGVIQPKIFIMDKKGYLDNTGSFLTRIGFIQHIGYMEKDAPKFNSEGITFSAKGACMLIRRKIIKKIGLFDVDFGSYFEETDFCWRVWLLGYKVLYFPKSFIYHKVGFSSKKQDQTFVFYHSLKNMHLSMIKNLSILNLLTIGGMRLALLICLAFYYLLNLQVKKFYMIFRAFFWNLINLPSTLQKRQQVQKFREKNDSELFRYILKPVEWKRMFSHFSKVEANFK